MKFFVAVTLVALVAIAQSATLTAEQKAKAAEHLAECRKDFKVTDEEVAKVKAGDVSGISEDGKCLSNCFLEKADVVENGALVESVILEKFAASVGEEKLKKAIEACRTPTGANNCEKAINYLACFHKNSVTVA